MREMVLNHASLVAPNSHAAMDWIVGMAKAMQIVCDRHLAKAHLQRNKELYEIECAGNSTLYQIAVEMLKTHSKEFAVLLLSLSDKAPPWDKRHDATEDRLLRCEVTGLDGRGVSPEDGAPLLYCAIADGIAVGFPSERVWEQDHVKVYFVELSTDGEELGELSETIDNLTRLDHAVAIVERHRVNTRDVSSFAEMWERRCEIFPNLVFGSDVEGQLRRVNTGYLERIVRKLSIIDAKSGDWESERNAGPPWKGIVRNESQTVYADPSLREHRLFAANDGNRKLFMYHASSSKGGRIHLRSIPDARVVEIGYIGTHLPTKKYR